jgi:glycine cleavage system H protein
MSNIPGNLRFTESHEWARLEADGTVTMGISDYAQHQMGEIVMVDLPAAGREVTKGDSLGALEAVKTASDYYAPVSGTVASANKALESDPSQVNQDCYGAGWLVVIKPSDASQMDSLMTPEQYRKHAGE